MSKFGHRKSIRIVTAKSKMSILPILESHIYNRYVESHVSKKLPYRFGEITEDTFIIEKEDVIKPMEYIRGKLIETNSGTDIIIETSDNKLFFKFILIIGIVFIGAVLLKQEHYLLSLLILLSALFSIRFMLISSKKEVESSLKKLSFEIQNWIEISE